MNGEDYWASFGTAISAIGAAIFWLYNIPLVSSVFTFLVGAFVTYLIQSKLQDRTEKRRLRVRAIEELHIPLYFQVENIKESLLLNLGNTSGSWHTLLEKPQVFTLTHDFKARLLNFFEKSKNVEEKISGVRSIVTEIVHINFEKKLFPALKEKNLVQLPEGTTELLVDIGRESIGFGIQLESPYKIDYVPIISCAILNREPTAYMETKHKVLEMDKLYLLIKVSYRYPLGGALQEQSFKIDLSKNSNLFIDFWNQTTDEISKNTDIIKFNSLRMELISVSDNLLSQLRKHIERYVETEKI